MPCLLLAAGSSFLVEPALGSSNSSQFFVVWSKLKQLAQCSRGVALAKAIAHAKRSTSPHFRFGWPATRLRKFRSYCIHSSPSNLRAACTIREEYARRSVGCWVATIDMKALKHYTHCRMLVILRRFFLPHLLPFSSELSSEFALSGSRSDISMNSSRIIFWISFYGTMVADGPSTMVVACTWPAVLASAASSGVAPSSALVCKVFAGKN